MPSHAFLHRRAARALVRRKADEVHILDARFSPTATFAEMTEIQPPNPILFTPPARTHGHHRPTRTAPVLPPLLTHKPPKPTTPIVPITPVTRPTPPAITRATTSATVSSLATVSTTSSVVPSTTSRVVTPSITPSSTIAPELDTVTSLTTVRHISSAASSASSTPSPTSGVNYGAIVGGVGGGVAAIAAISFAVLFFMRRMRKRRDEAIDFNPQDFRRSAVLLPDPPTHEDTVARGYNPPPPGPPMMEQPQQTPISMASAGYNEPYYRQEGAAYGAYSQYQEQYPSQGAYSNSPLPNPGGAAVSPYGHNPIALSPSLASPYEVTTPRPAGMSRQLTVDSHSHVPSTKSAQIPANDYVDLSRSSVSPFQAAQYAEISRRLKDIPSSAVAEDPATSPAELYATQQKDLPAIPPKHAGGPSISDGDTTYQARIGSTSPPMPTTNAADYTAPGPVSPAPVAVAALSHSVSSSSAALPSPSFVTAASSRQSMSPPAGTLSVQTSHFPMLSTDSFSHEQLEFPVPPSPTLSYSSRYRVDSSPPTLPEITVQDRYSVSSYIPQSPMIGSGYISGVSDMTMSGASGIGNMGLQSLPGSARSDGKFVPTKSPLASSVVVATPTQTHMSVFAAQQDKMLHDGPTVATPMPSTAKPVMN
ncbi:hypothetical protein Agabi119p4_6262 [Agaricus bisporus var. burnettii]|uniref:Uncharacterized protein n=1 Tax=Agaricus bisporus var. burnettii TaxID=192524 RepID=A0A8H7F013_AGABI|nr:hypothetical protein Agabi119p4_6262 [Agaricus bisporus var. burnettii]